MGRLACCPRLARARSRRFRRVPASGDSADTKSAAKELRDYGKARSLVRVTEDVERVQERTDGHALISTGIGAEDDAVGRAEKVTAAYRAYAKGAGKPSSVTVYNVCNVYGDSLVTR